MYYQETGTKIKIHGTKADTEEKVSSLIILYDFYSASTTLKYFDSILSGSNYNCLRLLCMFHFQGEIKPGTDVQCSYKEMHVKISADSFDKVDAAISIIELLVSSVTVSHHFMQCNNIL
jgi:hypothetical protein